MKRNVCLAILLGMNGLAIAESDLSISNPSSSPALVRVIGPSPHEKAVGPSQSATFALKDGIYRLRVRLDDASGPLYLESPVFNIADAPIGSRTIVKMQLPDPKRLSLGWHRSEKGAFSGGSKTNALDQCDSVASLIQLVTMPHKAPAGNNFNDNLAVFSDGANKFIKVLVAVDKITPSADRSRAIRELAGIAEANAAARDATERLVLGDAVSALALFKDKPAEVGPILSKYRQHANKRVAEAAERYFTETQGTEKR